MNRDEFPELRALRALWRDQAGPAQQGQVQALAQQIKVRARRQRLVDIVLGLLAIGPALVVIAFPALPLVRFGAVLALLALAWGIWRRQRLNKAALALDRSNPRAFLAAAIDNARAERRFLFVGVCLFTIVAGLWFFLIATNQGVEGFDFIPDQLLGMSRAKLTLLFIGAAGIYALFVQSILKARDRLRRLQAMAAEWDSEEREV